MPFAKKEYQKIKVKKKITTWCNFFLFSSFHQVLSGNDNNLYYRCSRWSGCGNDFLYIISGLGAFAGLLAGGREGGESRLAALWLGFCLWFCNSKKVAITTNNDAQKKCMY